MKKIFLLIVVLLSSSIIRAESAQTAFEKETFSGLLKDVYAAKTKQDYDTALERYIHFAHEHRYPLLAPSFEDVKRASAATKPTILSDSEVLRNAQASKYPQPFKYPATQPKKPASLIEKIKSFFRGLSPAPSK